MISKKSVINSSVLLQDLPHALIHCLILLLVCAVCDSPLKLFLLPQRVHTSLLIRCDKPELTRWCFCSLHACIQISPDEVAGSRDGCHHSITEGTVDVPMRLFRQIFSARTVLLLCPFAKSAAYIWSLFDFCKPVSYLKDPCNSHHFSPFMSPKGRVSSSNTSLRALCFQISETWRVLSTCHMQGDWYCLALPELAHMISRIFCHQSKCCTARPSPCFDTMPLFDLNCFCCWKQ